MSISYTPPPPPRYLSAPVRLVFACDERYVPFLGSAVRSFVSCSRAENEYEVVVLSDSLPDSAKEKLSSMIAGRQNIRMRFIEMSRELSGLEFSPFNGLPRVSYARLFLPFILTDWDKAVWLDCDVEVHADLAGLYSTDVTGFLLAAVSDSYINGIRSLKEHRAEAIYIASRLSLTQDMSYFNSGVMLLNLGEFRSRFCLKDIVSLACSDDFLWGDQDVLNMLCAERVLYLPREWNVIAGEKDDGLKEKAFIVHYAGPGPMKAGLLEKSPAEKDSRAETFRFPESRAACCYAMGRFSSVRIPTASMFRGLFKKLWAHLAMLMYCPATRRMSAQNSLLLDSMYDLARRKAMLTAKIRRAKERLARLERLLDGKVLLLLLLFPFVPVRSFCQESLKSVEEQYYDFLALDGDASSPSLNYRTMSDSAWHVEGNSVWNERFLGPAKSFPFRLYGPELFFSFNSAAPHGQNDGVLWQGKGINSSLTAGIRVEALGLELTVKPSVSFSQNQAFSYTMPHRDYVFDQEEVGDLYEGKASVYGYYGKSYVDAPQRFGESSFFSFTPGDSELRYTWHTLTAGFGWQSPWLGPAKLNPLLHSNNAVPYPKFDIGLRRTHLYLPWPGRYGIYLGDVEFRGWWGRLEESDYFDNDRSNDRSLLSAFSFAFAPALIPGLSVGVARTMQSKWEGIRPYTLFGIYDFLNYQAGGLDGTNGHFSLSFDYSLPAAGLELYLEWGRDDFSPDLNFLVRYPFHSQAWTVGGRKSFRITDGLRGELLLELSCLESSRDYEGLWGTTFYAHSRMTHGHTNGGQWLGAGIGTGGNSQYAGVKLYHRKGSVGVFFQRRNPDLDYTWFTDLGLGNSRRTANDLNWEKNIRATIGGGLTASGFIADRLRLDGKIELVREWNPLNSIDAEYDRRMNFHGELGLKYIF